MSLPRLVTLQKQEGRTKRRCHPQAIYPTVPLRVPEAWVGVPNVSKATTGPPIQMSACNLLDRLVGLPIREAHCIARANQTVRFNDKTDQSSLPSSRLSSELYLSTSLLNWDIRRH